MPSKREVYYIKLSKTWDNQCYALSREQVVEIYGEDKVSKNYQPCKDLPIKEDKT